MEHIDQVHMGETVEAEIDRKAENILARMIRNGATGPDVTEYRELSMLRADRMIRREVVASLQRGRRN